MLVGLRRSSEQQYALESMNVGNTINHDMPTPLLTQDSAGICLQNTVKSMKAQAVLKGYNMGINS